MPLKFKTNILFQNTENPRQTEKKNKINNVSVTDVCSVFRLSTIN